MEELSFDLLDAEFFFNLNASQIDDAHMFGLMDYYTGLYEMYLKENHPQRPRLDEIEAAYYNIWLYISTSHPEYLSDLVRRYDDSRLLKMLRRYNNLFEIHGKGEFCMNLAKEEYC